MEEDALAAELRTLAAEARQISKNGWLLVEERSVLLRASGALDKAADKINRLTIQLEKAHDARIEAQNPGIDMNEVRALRKKESKC